MGRVGEPDAAIAVFDHVIGRIEPLALIAVGDDRHGSVQFIAGDAAGQVLAGQLPALAVEAVAVRVVRGQPHHADMAIILQPAHLAIVRDVGKQQVLADRAPCRTLKPQPPVHSRRIGALPLRQHVEGRIDAENIGIAEIDVRGRIGREAARRRRHRAGRRRTFLREYRGRGQHHRRRPAPSVPSDCRLVMPAG